MIKIAIVEDEAAVRDQLTDYVRRYTRQYGTEFEVTCFTDGDEILENYRPAFDIIFLDVEMKRLNGMETAQRIRELDDDVLLIFITNMAQYAIKGYSVGALDYVLKPVPCFAFSQQLQKALGQLEKRSTSWPGGRGITWQSRWTAVCAAWTPPPSIIWKVTATRSAFTPRMATSSPPAR